MPFYLRRLASLLIAASVGWAAAAEPRPAAAEPRRSVAEPLQSTTPYADSWTGPYIGAGLGGRWNDASWSTTCLHPSLSNCSPPSDGFPTRFANDNPAPFNMSAMRLGAYAGYNWQIGNWVTGIEGDIAWAHDRKTHRGIPGTWDPALGPGRDATTVTTASWDGSLRGRIGVLATPDLLIYTTAGAAWLQTTAGASCQATFPIGWCVNPNSESVTKIVPGWTIGAGVEGRIAANLILRAEYRYSSYQDFRNTFFKTMPVESFQAEISQQTHTVYLGISYLFGAH